MFEADKAAATYIERDKHLVRHTPACDREGQDFVFQDPLQACWESLESYRPPLMKEDLTKLTSKPDFLQRLPPELVSKVVQYLPTADLHRLRAVSLTAFFATPPSFWKSRLQSDMPYAGLIRGKANPTFEVNYKHVKQVVTHGSGPAAASLRNLHRIGKHALEVIDIISSNLATNPRRSIKIALPTPPLNVSLLYVGQTTFVTGLWSSNDDSFSCGNHFRGQPVQFLPGGPCSGRFMFFGKEGGFIGLGFKGCESNQAHVAGQKSGPCTYQGLSPYKKGDILYLEFDSIKLKSVKIGPEDQLESPSLWMPHLPTCHTIDISTKFQPQDAEPRHLCYFGNPRAGLLGKLVQINAFYTNDREAITGLEFMYCDGHSLRWGSCFGTCYCRVIDGPSGERVTTLKAVEMDHGIGTIMLCTNAQRLLVFTSASPLVPLTANTTGQDLDKKGEAIITGVYGLFRHSSRFFPHASYSKTIGILSESLSAPAIVSKQDVTGDGNIPRSALQDLAQSLWKACISSASMENVHKIAVCINIHGRVTGMKFSYGSQTLDSILADFRRDGRKTEEQDLAFGEECTSKWLYWIYNALYDCLLANFETTSTS
ncbi:hypothetical protein L228DRAFT_270094 [Xylona heveae TC161]|uniref:F-box domain-containing protein n=1 Tax=Xylona heveae (strain CBS 132557 / TC161) TaxID=1328760 RepID=A0A165FC96_XYLHT|nr:hypothetical protein L228DRAFT_270094 [Xylona heveae TC161]KZF20815.1 hypothetical protein L228DRAFT_270094 [Xylona heveae TC161]